MGIKITEREHDVLIEMSVNGTTFTFGLMTYDYQQFFAEVMKNPPRVYPPVKVEKK